MTFRVSHPAGTIVKVDGEGAQLGKQSQLGDPSQRWEPSQRGEPRVAFWELARRVVAEAQQEGLSAPGFRSPPRVRGATRTLRRYRDGRCLVSVQGRGRPVSDVLADMVDGLLMANGLGGAAAESCRARIMEALAEAGRTAA